MNACRVIVYASKHVGLALTALLATAAMADWQSPSATEAAMQTAQVAPANGLVATIENSYFKITTDDVKSEIAKQLKLQAVEEQADIAFSPGTANIIHSADHPLKLVIHALQIDPQSKRWQAQAYVLADGKTETVKPISGTYTRLINVPVLKQQVGRHDVIEAADLSLKAVPERLMRKDTITDAQQLIGQSPRVTISADRPIRQTEVSAPLVIKKGQPVELLYTSQYMSIRTSGIALQDGAKGELIRVKNEKSEKAVSGRVVASGRVEVNQSSAM